MTFHSMPKNTDICSDWADVPAVVEIAPSNVLVTKREIGIIEVFFKKIVKHYKHLKV